MPDGESTLAAALNSLAALGTERDREQLLALLDRLDAGRVAELSVATFAVLNKADHLDEAGLAEASVFTRQVLAEAGHPGRCTRCRRGLPSAAAMPASPRSRPISPPTCRPGGRLTCARRRSRRAAGSRVRCWMRWR